MENNNKRKNDGRKYNKRKGRVKVIRNEGQLPAPRINKAKVDKAKKLAVKSIKDVFKSEDEIWKEIAKKAQEGSFNHLDMLMKYAYGKPGENKTSAPKSNKAPVIQFINQSNQDTSKEDVIDITHEEE